MATMRMRTGEPAHTHIRCDTIILLLLSKASFIYIIYTLVKVYAKASNDSIIMCTESRLKYIMVLHVQY